MKNLIFTCALVLVFALPSYGGYELEPPCHPDHECRTDSECAEEEAYFLDRDEWRQSESEVINLMELEKELGE